MKKLLITITLLLFVPSLAWAVKSTQTPSESRAKIQIPELQINIGKDATKFSAPKEVEIGGVTYLQIPWIAEYIRAIYNYTLNIVGIVAIIMIAIGGIIWLTAGGDSNKITTSKEYITGAVIGLFLTLGAYLILYIVNPNLTVFQPIDIQKIIPVPETEIETSGNSLCNNPNNPATFDDQLSCQSQTTCNTGNPCVQDQDRWCCACPDCVEIPSSIEVKNPGQSNTLSPSLITKLEKALNCSEKWRVTEAFPPTKAHKDKDHYNGRAVDVALYPNFNQDVKQRSDNQTQKKETLKQCLKNAGFSNVVDEYDHYYATTTGNHFHCE